MDNTEMPPGIGDQRIEKALGQIHGLLAAMYTLIATHPEPERLLQHLERAEMGAQSRALPVAVSEVFLDAMGDVMQRLQAVARRASGRK